MIMKTILASALLLIATTASSKPNDINGQPFKALETLILANEEQINTNNDLIASNLNTIKENSDAITSFTEQSNNVLLLIGLLNDRITTNELSILSIGNLLEANSMDITSIYSELSELNIKVVNNFVYFDSELNSLKALVSTLSEKLNALKVALSSAVISLDLAIEANTNEIALLTSIVASTNAKLTIATTNVLLLNNKVDIIQTAISEQSLALDKAQGDIVSLEIRISALEENSSSTTDIRSFTIHGTPNDDINRVDFITQLTDLNMQLGDFISISSSGSNGSGTICSGNINVSATISSYISGSKRYHRISDPSETYVRGVNNGAWLQASQLQVSSNTQSSDEIEFYSALSYSSGEWSSATIRPNNTGGYEINANGWDGYSNNSVTFNVASTRIAACGF